MTKRASRIDQPCHLRHWQAHVKALKQSGLSRAGYCRQYNLSYHALTYWHRKLSRPSSRETTLVPISIGRTTGQDSIQPNQAALKVVLPGSLSVEVGDNFSTTTLTRLLTVLESR